jgi:hypothetical protein
MAGEPSSKRDLPLSRWSSSELATQAVAKGLVSSVAASTVRRWLARDGSKPWQYRSWISPCDPGFPTKAGPVLDLPDSAICARGVPAEPCPRTPSDTASENGTYRRLRVATPLA